MIEAILKGLGRLPTQYLFRWAPTLKYPFRFDLLEVYRCLADGGIVTLKSAQSPRTGHVGHKVGAPRYYSVLDLIKVQLRIIR